MKHPEGELILLVDDEQSILDGLRRQHHKHFKLRTACGPEAGLTALEEQGPFAIVVSDFQMPGMTGAEFLARVRELQPETTRVMLTGQADVTTATEAVNRGNIFRFLSKPCEPERFREVLKAGLEQYRLVSAERVLLEQTVRGSIEVLSDVLALSNPAAFGRATRVRQYVRHMVEALNLADAWQYETAALLSQIGCVAVPTDLFERMGRGEELPPDQLAMIDKHPELGRDLLSKIPRLQAVAEMVYYQRTDTLPGKDAEVEVVLGSRILASALDYGALLSLGATPGQAIASLRKDVKKYGAKVLNALATAGSSEPATSVVMLPLSELKAGMVLEEEVRNLDEKLLVGSGHELNDGTLAKLRNYVELGSLKQITYRVRVPPEYASRAASA